MDIGEQVTPFVVGAAADYFNFPDFAQRGAELAAEHAWTALRERQRLQGLNPSDDPRNVNEDRTVLDEYLLGEDAWGVRRRNYLPPRTTRPLLNERGRRVLEAHRQRNAFLDERIMLDPHAWQEHVYGRLHDNTGPGFGNQAQWPFNMALAIRDPRYRQYVTDATTDNRYAENWQVAALDWLHTVTTRVRQIARENDAHEALVTLATDDISTWAADLPRMTITDLRVELQRPMPRQRRALLQREIRLRESSGNK